jgi:hypothetical protein
MLTYIHNVNSREVISPPLNRVSSVSERSIEHSEQARGHGHNSDESTVESVVNTSEDSKVPFPPLDTTICDFEDGAVRVALQDTSPKVEERNENHSPFKRWLSTLRRRHAQQPKPRGITHWIDEANYIRTGHQKSSSFSSSVGFLTAIKSATLTLAGTSIAPTSRHGRQGHLHSDNTSTSFLGARLSTDSAAGSCEPTTDGKAWYRSIQRRNIVDEILDSEESYISDMKAMIPVAAQ